jgi:hypothetical protein
MKTKNLKELKLPTGDFFAGLSRAEARSTVINWRQLVQNIKDQYIQHAGVTEGVQKDGIQNSWDARKKKHGKGWRLRFQLHTASKPNWFSFTDSGTHGLTGRILKPEELEADLPPNERWGRFENLAFTKGPAEGREALGARGQGKFIFVAGSEKLRILYDSLREGGKYRVGVRWVETVDSKVMAWDDDEAKEQLRQYSKDLQPLDAVGTRVIIDQPNIGLVQAVVSGSFARYIAITWWEIITRQNAVIEIDAGDGLGFVRVEAPSDFVLPESDTAQHLVSLKKNVGFSLSGKRYTIEELHLVSSRNGPVKDDIRGIALQRGGMRVMRLEMRHAPLDIVESVYGYARFDPDLDEAMKALEDPTHFSFNLHRGVGRKVREIIEKALDDFARDKLGTGTTTTSNVNDAAAHRALAEVNRIAKLLGVKLRGPGGGGGGGGGAGTQAPVRIVFDGGLKFPRPGSARVNYGQGLRAEGVDLVNDTTGSVEVRVSLVVTLAETNESTKIFEQDCTIGARTRKGLVTPFKLAVTRARYARGEWKITQKVVALKPINHGKESWERGKIVQEFSHRFWVEEDPPEFGIFESINLAEFVSPDDKLQYRVRPGSTAQRRLLDVNMSHPAYTELMSESEQVEQYIFEQAALATIEVDLDQEKSVLVPERDKLTPASLVRAATTQYAKIIAQYLEG